MHGGPTVIDYNLALNRFFRLKKFQVGTSGHARIFQPPQFIFGNSNPGYEVLATPFSPALHMRAIEMIYALN